MPLTPLAEAELDLILPWRNAPEVRQVALIVNPSTPRQSGRIPESSAMDGSTRSLWPLQDLIMRGHQDTVITALRCVEAFDAGPIYLKRPLNLNGNAEEIFLRADRVIESMIVTLIEEVPTPVPQQGEPTNFQRRRPEQGD